MAAIVPVPQPVVGNPGGNGLVVAFPKADEDFRVQGGATAATGGLHGEVRVAQQGDLVNGHVSGGDSRSCYRH